MANSLESTFYSVALTSCRSVKTIAPDWLELESRANHSIFNTWLWVLTWLESHHKQPLLARVTVEGRLVALGIFIIREETRYGVLRSRVGYLHQTGSELEDQVWVEYNGLLAKRGHEDSALTAVVQKLFADKHCDEIHLSMLPAQRAQLLESSRINGRVQYRINGYQRDLAACRKRGLSILESLSANSRQQIRRSLRRYEALHGTATLTHATNVKEATRLFELAGELHRLRWADSGFNNRAFVSFHEDLIKRGFDHGSVTLSRFAVGDELIGVFYCLVVNKRVFFYLQGLRRENDGKLKPGLCGHYLLMQHFLEQGMDEYDFMGGESQYKQQLSDRQNVFTTLRLHNGDWKYLLEDRIRQFKHRLLGP